MTYWCVLAPALFDTCMDWVTCNVDEDTHVGNIKITGLVFFDDAEFLPESLEVVVMTLEVLH